MNNQCEIHKGDQQPEVARLIELLVERVKNLTDQIKGLLAYNRQAISCDVADEIIIKVKAFDVFVDSLMGNQCLGDQDLQERVIEAKSVLAAAMLDVQDLMVVSDETVERSRSQGALAQRQAASEPLPGAESDGEAHRR
jgi:hypothetical protein